ncbi:MAG: DUF4241 domain-containing protein [Alphaproteobacteria bacterium]|nr:DUF4241 domain-containing protein [Alphaproteobacteria bacterium]
MMSTIWLGIKAIGVILMLLLMLLVPLLGWGWLSEKRREKKWRDAGFAEFLQAGAPLDHKEFIEAFNKETFALSDKEIVSSHKAGSIHLPSGRIMVGDPSYLVDPNDTIEPFQQSVPPGEYPVYVLVSRGVDQRCAAIKVVFSDKPETRVNPAWTASARKKALDDLWLADFGVDSARAGVFAVEAEQLFAEPDAILHLHDYWLGENVENPYLSKEPSALWTAFKKEGVVLGVVACSGFGDGLYHCYFSYDSDDQPVALYIDFDFFGDAKWAWPKQP